MGRINDAFEVQGFSRVGVAGISDGNIKCSILKSRDVPYFLAKQIAAVERFRQKACR